MSILLSPVMPAKWSLAVPFTKDIGQMTSNGKWAWGKLKMVHEQPETGKRGKVSWREPYNLVPAEQIDKLYIVLRLTQCIKTNPAASFRDKHSFRVPWTVFSNTNVQSNPGTSSKWTDLAVGTAQLPPFLAVFVQREKFTLKGLMLLAWLCSVFVSVSQILANTM